ncbi:MAG: OmpA family protein [Bacteroidota bacterium]|nr:OmpA family protein [Bacteroidota bacterium]
MALIRISAMVILLLAGCCFRQADAQIQPPSTHSKKAERFFADAANFYNARQYEKANNCLDRALKEDSLFTEAYLLKGDIRSDQQDLPGAVDFYKAAIRSNPDFSPQIYYITANIEMMLCRYQEAKKDMEKFLTFQNLPENKADKAKKALKSCDFGIRQMDNPVPFQPVNLGDSINSDVDEYVNYITPDDHRLYFTRKLPKSNVSPAQGNAYQEDFFYADRTDSVWHNAVSLGPPINTPENEGALTLSPDGNYLFFAACERPDGFGSCDLYWSKKIGNEWTTAENIGPVVNSPAWDSQPSFSSDGRTLYFASKRAGGKGSSDIWKSILLPDGSWANPVNLGDSINTPAEEMSPFIHPDGQTLYFASRGHQGMGKFDLFVSRMKPDGSWSTPKNLGYPINTCADELNFIVNASGDMAYISSDKLGGKGKQDIYSFKLYKDARPEKVTYFKGIVYDKDTKKRLGARFELLDLDAGTTVITSSSDPLSGEFLLTLPANRNYMLNVSKEGYLFYSDHFEMKDEASITRPFLKDIPLQPIKVGVSVILKNIFFDTDKFDLKPESIMELQRLLDLLKKNPKIKIEISGHTDNVGTPEYNITLSRNRAKAVYDYLIQQGIPAGRLSYQGYGLTKPIDTNDTPEGRANNRRTEFRVVGVGIVGANN